MESDKKLTDKQRAFIAAYVVCWNGAEAARRAGYSEDCAHEIAAQNLAKVSIKAEVKRYVDELVMSPQETLLRFGEQARATLDDFYDFIPGVEGGFLNLAKAKERGKIHLIKKIKYNRFGQPEIELHDVQFALDKIAKAHGLYQDTTNNTTNQQIAVVIGTTGTSTVPSRFASLTAASGEGDEEI